MLNDIRCIYSMNGEPKVSEKWSEMATRIIAEWLLSLNKPKTIFT